MAATEARVKLHSRELAVVVALLGTLASLLFTIGILAGKWMSDRSRPTTACAAPSSDPAPSGGKATVSTTPATKSTTAGSSTEAKSKPVESQGTPVTRSPAADTAKAVAGEKGGAPAALPEKKMEAEKPATVGKSTADKATPASAEHQEKAAAPTEKTVAAASAAKGNATAEKLAAPKEKESASPQSSAVQSPAVQAPPSYARGRYSVQVAAYPDQKSAQHYIGWLKSLGFAHAYSTEGLPSGESRTWYRIWLGYFADAESAKVAGDFVKQQSRGEIDEYLVRRVR